MQAVAAEFPGCAENSTAGEKSFQSQQTTSSKWRKRAKGYRIESQSSVKSKEADLPLAGWSRQNSLYFFRDRRRKPI